MLREYPLVSIVTPSYNQGRYIEATIQSVLNQDYPNLEYIVVDGGSMDGTVDILKKYEGRLIWISEKDRGQADAINKGFRMAKGEILGWLNSDDTYLPGAIHKVVQYFQAHPDVGMVYGEGYHVDGRGNIIERYYTEPFDYQRLGEICFICQPTAFFRAEVFRRVGPLDISLRYCLDYEYWMRVAKRFQIGYLNEYLANSRLHMDTKTLSKRVEVHEEILQTVKNHYGQVPARWIYAYAHVYLTEKLMPNIQGIYGDGWASQRVRVFLRDDWRRYPYLSLQGASSVYASPLPLRIAVGDQVLHEAIIEGGEFSLREQIWRNDVLLDRLDTVEATLYADKSFIPQMLGMNDDTRPLSYRVRRLALLDERGRELVLYSDRIPWLLAIALPALFLWKSLLINHCIPYEELWKHGRRLWNYLKRSLSGQ